MNNSIKKIIIDLKDVFESTKYIITNERNDKHNPVNIFKYQVGLFTIWMESDTTLNNYQIISDDFKVINNIITGSRNHSEGLNEYRDKDIFNIFMYFINKNIQNGILDNTRQFITLNEARQKHDLSIKILAEYENENNNSHLKSCKIINKKTNETLVQNPNEVYILTAISKKRLEDIQKSHRIIKEFYFDKLDTFEKDDIEKIVQAIGVWEYTALIKKAVRNTLEKKLAKRREPQKEVEIKRIERVSKPILTKKEYHEIKDELDSKFDFERMEPRIDVTLAPEEISHCIDLMNQLSFTDREKEIFLEKSFKKSREELLNIDSIMNLLQSQIEFYNINNETVNKAMENLELYIEEYKNVEDIIEKEEWYELIKDEIRIVNTFIPKTFEYEKSMLLQKRVN